MINGSVTQINTGHTPRRTAATRNYAAFWEMSYRMTPSDLSEKSHTACHTMARHTFFSSRPLSNDSSCKVGCLPSWSIMAVCSLITLHTIVCRFIGSRITLPQSAKPQWMAWCTHHVAYVLKRNPCLFRFLCSTRTGHDKTKTKRANGEGQTRRTKDKSEGERETERDGGRIQGTVKKELLRHLARESD